MADAAEIAELRAFTRTWTRAAGVLRLGVRDSPFSVAEARVIYELAQAPEGCELLDLRRRLDLDAAYLSRTVGKLERDGLVRTGRARDDARKRTAALTARGRRAFASLDARSSADAAGLLGRFGAADRARLLGAMGTVRGLLEGEDAGRLVVLRAPRAGDLGWIVEANARVYAETYGWNVEFEALVARIVAEYAEDPDPACEAVWIAELAGEAVGCIMCVRRDETSAQLRMLFVEPSARGLGLGARLVGECLDFARRAGYERIVLWTQDTLVAARRIYQAAGFALDSEERHRSFGHDLVGQMWSREL